MNVTQVASLANLSLSSDQLTRFEKQLSDVLHYIEQLNSVDTTNVTPTSQVTGLENVTRVDTSSHSFTQEEALSQASGIQNGFFQVKGIFENE